MVVQGRAEVLLDRAITRISSSEIGQLLVRWRLAGASACLACAPGTYTNFTNGTGAEKERYADMLRGGARRRELW